MLSIQCAILGVQQAILLQPPFVRQLGASSKYRLSGLIRPGVPEFNFAFQGSVHASVFRVYNLAQKL